MHLLQESTSSLTGSTQNISVSLRRPTSGIENKGCHPKVAEGCPNLGHFLENHWMGKSINLVGMQLVCSNEAVGSDLEFLINRNNRKFTLLI